MRRASLLFLSTCAGSVAAQRWECQVGQGGKNQASTYKNSTDNSESACGDFCLANHDCLAFDFTTKQKSLACRLFRTLDSRLGDGGGDHRVYCLLTSRPPTPPPAPTPTPTPLPPWPPAPSPPPTPSPSPTPPTPSPSPTPPPSPTPAHHLLVPVSADGSYSVLVGGEVWFHSSHTSFRHGSKDHTTKEGSLTLSSQESEQGDDIHGAFNLTTSKWKSDQGVAFETSVKVYNEVAMAVFTQTFPDGAKATSVGDRDKIISSFPSFSPAWSEPRGFVSFQGTHQGASNSVFGQWSSAMSNGKDIVGSGIAGSGPVVVFMQDLQDSLVLSAFSNFMAHNQLVSDSTISYGPMGGITSVPAGYRMSTVISAGSGINAAMEKWGDSLLREYGKERFAYKRDFALRHLGFSTDNGAYYYRHTEPGKNYEDTLLGVADYASKVGLPYKYVLLDSWWYYKSTDGGSGVKNWTAKDDIFPDGLDGFYKKSSWPQQLHNRFWAPDNVYMRRNGGRYHFICDDDMGHDSTQVCVPADPDFWTDLMANKTGSGMFMYEQDWLRNEFDWSVVMGTENATLGRDWLMQMNEGAVNANVTIQLCMAYVRHIMQSVEMSQVTNARASVDYHPGNWQWRVGVSSIVNHALGLAPSKDNYWSTRDQPDSKYGKSTAEPHSRLQSVVSSLTTGPVAPSDRIGLSNVSLIMRACDASGRLLTPDRPATEIDQSLVQKAFGGPLKRAQVWTTSVTLDCIIAHRQSRCTWQYLLAVNLPSEYDVEVDGASSQAFDIIDADTSTIISLGPGQGSSLTIPSCNEDDFHFYIIAPQSARLLGEPDKWISVSPQRFSELSTSKGDLRTSVHVHGIPGEVVSVRWSVPNYGIVTSKCHIGTSGVSIASADLQTGKATCEAEAYMSVV